MNSELKKTETQKDITDAQGLIIVLSGKSINRADQSSNIMEQYDIVTQMAGVVREIKMNLYATVQGLETMNFMQSIESNGSSRSMLMGRDEVITKVSEPDGQAKFFATSGLPNFQNYGLSRGGEQPASPSQIMKINEFSNTVMSAKNTVPIARETKSSVMISDMFTQRNLQFSYGEKQSEIDSEGAIKVYEVDESMTYTNTAESFFLTERIKGHRKKSCLYFKPEITLQSCKLDSNGMTWIILLDNGQIGAPQPKSNPSSLSFDVELEKLSATDEEYCRTLFALKFKQIPDLKQTAANRGLEQILKMDELKKALGNELKA